MNLDGFDLKILEIVQRNNLKSHADIGMEVNLSASSVRRRLAAMREAQIIIADVALTDPTQLGLTFIVYISFEYEEPEIYTAFRKQMTSDLAVSQCYSVSGEFDFIIIVHAATPAAYEAWGERTLMSNSAIRPYEIYNQY